MTLPADARPSEGADRSARTDGRRRTLVLRGDVRSSMGYGYQTRAYAELAPAGCEVFGVDLHPNPKDCGGVFTGELVDDDAVARLAADGGRATCVVTVATPEHYAYFPGAWNVGLFPWETDTFSYALDWPELIASMDDNWSMTPFHQGLLRRHGWGAPSPLVPWPFDFEAEQPSPPGAGATARFTYLDRLPAGAPEADGLTLDVLPRPLILTVSSLAPRKGLPILLSEWRDHVENGGAGVLALKLRPIHHGGADAAGGGWPFLRRLLTNVGLRPGEPTRIAFSFEDLPYAQVGELYRAVDAYATASFGEGFGGPVLEALLAGVPVIAPRHTSLADLLPADDPLQLAARSLYVGLEGNPAVYPAASNWWTPERGAVVAALRRLDAMTPQERTALAERAREHARRFCSRPVVAAALENALEQMRA